MAVHVKGLELPGYDPRVLKGCGLAFATADSGACHLRAPFHNPEIKGVIAPEIIKRKAENKILEKILSQKKPLCPHYGKEMNIWEVPPFSFCDDLGLGKIFTLTWGVHTSRRCGQLVSCPILLSCRIALGLERN